MHDDGQDDGQVYHETVIEDQLAYHAQTGEAGNGGPVDGAGGSHGDLAHAAGHGVEAAAEEVGDAAAEDGQRQTGDVLVGPQGDGQEAVKQAAQSGDQERCQEGDQQAHKAVGIGVIELIEERGRQTRDAAQVHDARDAQVQIAGFLRQNFADGAVHDDGAEANRGLQQTDDKVTHLASASFLPRRITR